jgi:hypothetical protein
MAEPHIEIHIPDQSLLLIQGDKLLQRYAVSTALNGPGQRSDSGCTPLGRHHIRLAIGAGCPLGTVFVGRRPTGEIWTPQLAQAEPERDWILTRILWLSGDEPGFNRGGACDSLRRFVYIHGTPDTEPMGEPRSHGCVRMRNRDICELFERVGPGTRVEIRNTRYREVC